MAAHPSDVPAAVALPEDDEDTGLQEDGQTEADEADMAYDVMDEDEEAEQDAARRLQEDLKKKRMVGGICVT